MYNVDEVALPDMPMTREYYSTQHYVYAHSLGGFGHVLHYFIWCIITCKRGCLKLILANSNHQKSATNLPMNVPNADIYDATKLCMYRARLSLNINLPKGGQGGTMLTRLYSIFASN